MIKSRHFFSLLGVLVTLVSASAARAACTPTGITVAYPTLTVKRCWNASELGLPKTLGGMLFSADGTRLYVIAAADTTSSAIYRLNVTRAGSEVTNLTLAPVAPGCATPGCPIAGVSPDSMSGLDAGLEVGPSGTVFDTYVGAADSNLDAIPVLGERPNGPGTSETRFTFSGLSLPDWIAGVAFSPFRLDAGTNFGKLQASLVFGAIYEIALSPSGTAGIFNPGTSQAFVFMTPSNVGAIEYVPAGPFAGDIVYAANDFGSTPTDIGLHRLKIDAATGLPINKNTNKPQLGTGAPIDESFATGFSPGPIGLEFDAGTNDDLFVSTFDNGNGATNHDKIYQIGGFSHPLPTTTTTSTTTTSTTTTSTTTTSTTTTAAPTTTTSITSTTQPATTTTAAATTTTTTAAPTTTTTTPTTTSTTTTQPTTTTTIATTTTTTSTTTTAAPTTTTTTTTQAATTTTTAPTTTTTSTTTVQATTTTTSTTTTQPTTTTTSTTTTQPTTTTAPTTTTTAQPTTTTTTTTTTITVTLPTTTTTSTTTTTKPTTTSTTTTAVPTTTTTATTPTTTTVPTTTTIATTTTTQPTTTTIAVTTTTQPATTTTIATTTTQPTTTTIATTTTTRPSTTTTAAASTTTTHPTTTTTTAAASTTTTHPTTTTTTTLASTTTTTLASTTTTTLASTTTTTLGSTTTTRATTTTTSTTATTATSSTAASTSTTSTTGASSTTTSPLPPPSTTTTTLPTVGCELGGVAACDDGDTCTIDNCVAGQGCTHTPKTGLDSVTCTCTRAAPSACADQTLPKATRRLEDRACRLFLQVGGKLGRQKRKLLNGAASLHDARRFALRAKKTDVISAGCADALLGQLQDAETRARTFASTLVAARTGG